MNDSLILSSFGVFVDQIKEERFLEDDGKNIKIEITLDTNESTCPNCGSFRMHRIKDYRLKKYTFVNPNGKTIIVYFRQKRFECKDCGKTYLERNPFISNGKYKLSKDLILLIIDKLRDSFLSVKYIAKSVGVSDHSIFNVIDEYLKFDRKKLPRFLSLDEFKAFGVESDVGKYPCVLLNTVTHQPIDIIRTRKADWMLDYFSKIPEQERLGVKYVVIDMYEPYKNIVNKMMPNAIIAIDPFHYVRYVTDAMDQTRIEIQKFYDETSKEYKALKRNRDLLRRRKDADYSKRRKASYLGNSSYPETVLLKYVLGLSDKLADAYDMCHSFLKNYRKVTNNNGIEFLKKTISRFEGSGNKYFEEVAKTFKNWIYEINNSFIKFDNGFVLSNGPIEGANNIIKVIKRISFGMSNFEHQRARILLHFSK